MNAGALQLAWPLAATGYHLETATALAAGTLWTSNNTVFVVTNGQNMVTPNLSIGTTPLFYRLSRP
jgi:hypothetical protein